jgi:hypothetical protein
MELTSVSNPKRAISCSMGFETEFAATCAVAPGTFVMTKTCGGVESGNKFLGKVTNAMIPTTKNPKMMEYNKYGLL